MSAVAPAGARVLGRFAERIRAIPHEMLVVVNFRRPETNTPEKALDYLREIECSAGLSVTGLINNTHLCEETTAEDILFGAEMAQQVSAMSGVPLRHHTCAANLYKGLALSKESIYPLNLYLTKPWESAKGNC